MLRCLLAFKKKKHNTVFHLLRCNDERMHLSESQANKMNRTCHIITIYNFFNCEKCRISCSLPYCMNVFRIITNFYPLGREKKW